MDSFLDKFSYIIYPDNYIESKLKMIIYLTDKDIKKNKSLIYILHTKYNSVENKCYMDNIHLMIIIEDIYLLSLLVDIFCKRFYKKGPTYYEFINIYKNQHKYFKNMYFL